MSQPDLTAAAAALVARYAAARALTQTMRADVDADQFDRLDELAARRSYELEVAGDLVVALGHARDVLTDEQLHQLQAELSALIKEDQLLRAVLASRAQQIPGQLAELRGAHAALGSYQAGAVAARDDLCPSDPLDRRG